MKTDFFPRESFTFRGHREETGAVVYSSVARVDSTGKLDSPSDQRPRKGKLSQGKENSLIVQFPSWGNAFLAGDAFSSLKGFSKHLVGQNYKMAKWYMLK